MRSIISVITIAAIFACTHVATDDKLAESGVALDSIAEVTKDSPGVWYGIFDLHKEIPPDMRNSATRRYMGKNCDTIKYSKGDYDFEGFVRIGDINHDGRLDSVCVLPPLAWCSFPGEDKEIDGDSYYFSDTSIPRLHTPSRCCHPSSIFSVGDINEDGFDEIGEYQSSCASRYKLLKLHAMRNGQWANVGYVVYDLLYADTSKSFSQYFRKISKGKVEMLEVTDLRTNNEQIVKPIWRRFSL